MNNTKSIFLSKTIWLNTASLVVIFANRNAEIIDPAVVEPFALVAVSLANMLLRKMTTSGVHVLRGTGDGGPQ